MNQAWKQWEGQAVGGGFPLLQYLGGSDQSGVFLTEYANQEHKRAAIKLIPSEPGGLEPQLARYKLAGQLAHPHLIRLFDIGGCRLGGMELLYVVMEYAEDDLSQLIPNRPLAPTEALEMLRPVLEALGYVHEKGFVHGRLKPSNIMAVNGQLKVSSDGLRLVGEPYAGIERRSVYDPPELPSGHISPAGDIWSLGILLVEVLTQRPLVWQETEEGDPIVPEEILLPFREYVSSCLRRDPQQRWTATDFAQRLLDASPSAGGQTAVQPSGIPSKSRYIGPALAVGLLLAGVLVGTRFLNRQSETPRIPSTTEQPAGQPEGPPTVPQVTEEANPGSSIPVPGEVANRVLPNVPQSARDTIQGTVRVSIRIRVDETGNVADAELDSPGPSQYFARLALQAARLWIFTPPKVDQRNVASEWILRFGFTRAETAVDAVQVIP